MKINKINPFSDIPQDKLSYFAGIIDGEGYFEVRHETEKRRKKGYYPRIRITIGNTFYPLIEWIKNIFGGYVGKDVLRSQKHKICYRLCISNKNKIRCLLPLLLPYLIVKKEKAKDILDNWDSYIK